MLSFATMNRPPATPAAELLAAIERIRGLSNRLSRLLQQQLGTTVYQVGILAAVEEGARRLHEVAEATGHHVSGASRLVDRMVSDGLLDRQPDPVDRRAVVLALTDAGTEQLTQARRLVGGIVQQALDGMPRATARQLVPVLGSFLDAADTVLDQETGDRRGPEADPSSAGAR
jgi:DNA-binding MarR family transcriptional regulator